MRLLWCGPLQEAFVKALWDTLNNFSRTDADEFFCVIIAIQMPFKLYAALVISLTGSIRKSLMGYSEELSKDWHIPIYWVIIATHVVCCPCGVVPLAGGVREIPSGILELPFQRVMPTIFHCHSGLMLLLCPIAVSLGLQEAFVKALRDTLNHFSHPDAHEFTALPLSKNIQYKILIVSVYCCVFKDYHMLSVWCGIPCRWRL